MDEQQKRVENILRKAIIKSLKQGKNQEHIIKTLLENHWPINTINNVFNSIDINKYQKKLEIFRREDKIQADKKHTIIVPDVAFKEKIPFWKKRDKVTKSRQQRIIQKKSASLKLQEESRPSTKPENKKLLKGFIFLIALILLALLVYLTLNITPSNYTKFIKPELFMYFIGSLAILIAIILIIKNRKKKERPIKKSAKVTRSELEEILKSESNQYETDFDKLYHAVEKLERISTKNIAEAFKISEKEAEDRAKILEEHKLAKIEYTLFGSPVLVKISKNKKENGDKKTD